MLTYFKLARILFWKLLIDLLISYFLCEKVIITVYGNILYN